MEDVSEGFPYCAITRSIVISEYNNSEAIVAYGGRANGIPRNRLVPLENFPVNVPLSSTIEGPALAVRVEGAAAVIEIKVKAVHIRVQLRRHIAE